MGQAPRQSVQRYRARALGVWLWTTCLVLIGTGDLLRATSVEAAPGAKLRVRGRATIEAYAKPLDEQLEIRGHLVDDAGRPVANAHLRLRVLDADRPRRLRPPRSCGRTGAVHLSRGFGGQPDEYVLDTDAAGTFCVIVPERVQRGSIRLTFDDDIMYEPADVELPIDASRRALTLTFSPEPPPLALERRSHVLFVDTRVEPPFSAETPAAPLHLTLALEPPRGKPRKLAEARVVGGERAQFELSSNALGEPGPATLVTRFQGNRDLQPAEHRARITRTAKVDLNLDGAPPEGNPSEGIVVRVAASSSAGVVTSGSVEARCADSTVGIAPVDAGTANVLVRFKPPRDEQQVPLSFRYLPAEPWWVPDGHLETALRITPPSPWRSLPWIVAAGLVAAWLLWTLRRPTRHDLTPGGKPAEQPTGRASLQVVAPGKAKTGWRGVVLDAHDGTPITNASVSLIAATFEGDGVRGACATDDAGYFALQSPQLPTREGARLVIRAPWHSTLERSLPREGELAIQLVARRRALLDRLVQWAERRGMPWRRDVDPTPGEVRTVAQAEGAAGVENWAAGIEHAAFSDQPVDEKVEAELREREPG